MCVFTCNCGPKKVARTSQAKTLELPLSLLLLQLLLPALLFAPVSWTQLLTMFASSSLLILLLIFCFGRLFELLLARFFSLQVQFTEYYCFSAAAAAKRCKNAQNTEKHATATAATTTTGKKLAFDVKILGKIQTNKIKYSIIIWPRQGLFGYCWRRQRALMA